MEYNPSKCQVLNITRARTPIRHQFVLHGHVLEAVDHAILKYSGLEISHDLKNEGHDWFPDLNTLNYWNTHIQNLTTKANRTLGFVRRKYTSFIYRG